MTTQNSLKALALCVFGMWAGLGLAQAGMPPPVQAALKQAQLPAEALSVVVSRVQDPVSQARWRHLDTTPRNPASLIKLVTTTAALDALGTTYTWNTQIYTDGTLSGGVLKGNLYLKGEGDPSWVMEKLWQLMRRIQGLGIHRIEGDVVLDRSAFNLPPHEPGSFDGEPLKPYNVGPDAWLVNHHAVSLFISPDIETRVARVTAEPPRVGAQVQTELPLVSGPCNDYRARMGLDVANPTHWRWRGAFPVSCGDKRWSVAAPPGPAFSQQVLHALWLSVGGQLSGQVRDGVVPPAATLRLEAQADPLNEVVLRINKFSNNVMAKQLFLTLGRGSETPLPAATWERSRAFVARWWHEQLGAVPAPTVINGAGLSRDTRVQAQSLAALLHWAWQQPFFPELAASLPVTGTDGTLKRSKAQAWAHLKTGSLRDVSGIAGYVEGRAGQRWVVVAIVNHPNANRSRPVLDAIVDWASRQR